MTGLRTLHSLLTSGRANHLTLSHQAGFLILICQSLLGHKVGLALELPGELSLTSRARQGLSQLSLIQALQA